MRGVMRLCGYLLLAMLIYYEVRNIIAGYLIVMRFKRGLSTKFIELGVAIRKAW